MNKLTCLAVLVAGLAATGCEEKKPAPAAGGAPAATGDAAKGMMDAAKTAAGDAAKSASDAVAAKVDEAKKAGGEMLAAAKDKAVAAAQTIVDDAKAKLPEWQKQADGLAAPLKAAVQPMLGQVQPQIDSISKMIGDMKTGDITQSALDSLSSASGKLGELVKQIGDKLK
jgi:vacuolar-type H+-ATPase subunit H